MSIREFLLGRDEFKSPDEIIELIRQYRGFDPEQEDISHAEALLIFQTSKQQTWLVATSVRLYCVLDDLKKSFTRAQWSYSKDTLVSNTEVTVRISARNKTEKTGLVDIGEHRNWLYSRKLFANEPIENRIRDLIARHMIH